MDRVLEISGLTKRFKNGRGIENIGLEISRGDIFGFLGPNGAGKSTTMKIMTGLMKADSGDVRIFGHSIAGEPERALRNVGCIIENVEPYPYLTAYDNLMQRARYYSEIDEARIDEALELTGIKKYRREKVKYFSMGMKQRLGIAGAILTKPELVILDEPLNGLDVEGMVQMRNLIKNLAEWEKTTFFISSHFIHDIELTCNKIGIIYNGRILSVEYTENILSDFDSLENYFISGVEGNGRL